MYSTRCFEREKKVPQLSPIKETIKYVFQSAFFKGHISIPWIQISMEKAYQSNFAQPSTQPNWNETDYDKGYFSPFL